VEQTKMTTQDNITLTVFQTITLKNTWCAATSMLRTQIKWSAARSVGKQTNVRSTRSGQWWLLRCAAASRQPIKLLSFAAQPVQVRSSFVKNGTQLVVSKEDFPLLSGLEIDFESILRTSTWCFVTRMLNMPAVVVRASTINKARSVRVSGAPAERSLLRTSDI
jgi:hypothetical protein